MSSLFRRSKQWIFSVTMLLLHSRSKPLQIPLLISFLVNKLKSLISKELFTMNHQPQKPQMVSNGDFLRKDVNIFYDSIFDKKGIV